MASFLKRSLSVLWSNSSRCTLNSHTRIALPTASWKTTLESVGPASTKGNSFYPRASFSTGSVWQHGAMARPKPGEGCKVNFITREGETVTVEANVGESLLDVARANDLDVEGACEASLACSTCHLILDDASYDKLEEPSDEENDMLDLAFGLADTSRLGCQVLMTKELSGLTAKIPSATRNMYVDGAKPKHH